MTKLLTYTNAPESYDFSWARTIVDNVAESRKGPIRLVEHDDDWHMEQQRMRYGSGMFIAMNPDQFKEFANSDLYTMNSDDVQRKHYRKSYEIPYSDETIEAIEQVLESVKDIPEYQGRFDSVWNVQIHVIHDLELFNKLCSTFEKLKELIEAKSN